MKLLRVASLVLTAAALAATAPVPGGNGLSGTHARAAEAIGTWREKSQLVWNAKTRQMERRMLRVWDTENRRDQEFSWDASAASGPLENGPVNGSGTLVWRERGASSYDRQSIVSTYRGSMQNGRPHGEGALSTRDGLTYAGEWRDGMMHGRGELRYTNGDRYTGRFASGLPHGAGRYARANGELYNGEFDNGRRHGLGILTSPQGVVFQTEWAYGKELPASARRRNTEIANEPTDLTAHLMPAANTVDVDRIEVSVVVDQKISKLYQQAYGGVSYIHTQSPGETSIAPDDPELMNRWKGGGTISYSWLSQEAPAFIKFVVRNKTGRYAYFQSAYLHVSDSATDMHPLLGLNSHWGCVGYRPTFNMINNGWGPAENSKLEFSFARDELAAPADTYQHSLDVGSIDDGQDVYVETALRDAGVDVEKLKAARFTCPSYEQLPGCGSDIKAKLQLGSLGRHVEVVDNYVRTTLIGKMRYSWRDNQGETHQGASVVKTPILLGFIDVPAFAECSDLPPPDVTLPKVPEIRFGLDKQDYRVEVPLQGVTRLGRENEYVVSAKVDKGSQHEFKLVLVFTDGSEKVSRPVKFQFYKPRPSKFESKVEVPACYIEETC